MTKELKLPTTNAQEINKGTLDKEVELNNPLKSWLVGYVGEKISPEDDVVRVEHIVEVLAQEFPEFLMVVAEENWIRGYQQGITDVEEGMRIAKTQGHQIVVVINRGDDQSHFGNADVAIDFSTPDAAPILISAALDAGLPVVSGTTGWLSQYDDIS